MNAPASSQVLNPLLADWTTPMGLPPFAEIRPEHYEPAFAAALSAQRAELDALATQTEAPSFDNTVAAFDRSGRLLARIEGVFHNLTSSETSPALQAVELAMAPRLAAHRNAIYMHAGLFARIDALMTQTQQGQLKLDAQAQRLLERIHLDFVRAGAKLAGAAQARYAQIMEELATLHTQFGQNVLHDESSYQLVLRTEADLAGLPAFVRAAARQAAQDRGVADAWVITLSRSHIVPFLTFSERRDLREQAWRAWTSRGEHAGEHDNRPVAQRILTLRNEQARLHGHPHYAAYALTDTMARTPQAVQGLLAQVWEPAKAKAAQERELLEVAMRERGDDLTLEAWDWRFYAEKVRQARYQIDEAETKPYFPLERMVDAIFDCAGQLFGLQFKPQADWPVYHPDVRAYEVSFKDGTHVGVFLHDNFARSSKRSGAWMSLYREQTRNSADGRPVRPIVVNNNNFAKGAPGEPTLLSFDDARTLFHEFGHGLHGLLSDVGYERLSGTNVLRDFVELPSQIFEHWLSEPAVLRKHARHWQTGAVIPEDLVQRIEAAAKFNQGYETVRYTASALVDLAIHMDTAEQAPDIVAFEAAELARLGLPPAVGLNHRLPHFQHLFAGSSYASGYYVYMWAEVLDCDGYTAFTEAGNPFDPVVAERLQRCILSAGNSQDPALAFRDFRGRDPQVEPMLRDRGLIA